METKSASATAACAPHSRPPADASSQQARMISASDGNEPRIAGQTNRLSTVYDSTPHRATRLAPPIPPKPAPRAIRDDSSNQQSQQTQLRAVRGSPVREIARTPLVPTPPCPGNDNESGHIEAFRRPHYQHHQPLGNTLSSLSKSAEDDSNDSDESEDTFQDFDDLRDCVKTDGDQVVVPESIDSFVIDDGSEKTRVQLTERQRKSLENRLSTFSMRVKNKQNNKTNLRELFEPMKQTYPVAPADVTVVDGNDGFSRGQRSTTYEHFDEFKPQRHPKLAPLVSEKLASKHASSNLYSSSNLSRFQSTPNIASPDLYGGQPAHKRIEALKNQGKNIRQKFKNLFGVKQTKKNFNLGESPLGEQTNRGRTASSNNDDDEEPLPTNSVTRRHEERNSYTNSSHITPGHYRSSKIDTDVQYTGGVEIRSIRYNASYRKPNKKSEIRRVTLLDPLYIEPDVDLADTLSEYGVEFYLEDNHFKSFSLRFNVNWIHDLTKNYATAASKVALLELTADLKDVFMRGNESDVKMPRFKDTRKKATPNLIFGGYLTQLHTMDKKRNANQTDVNCPSVLKHMISYLEENGIREEGIFRITGTQNRLNNLKNELNMLYQSYYKHNKPDDRHEIQGILSKYSAYDVAGLLKLFLRELTKPLFTDELMEIFLKVPSICRLDMQIKVLNLLLLILNESHRNSLSAILQLLHLVVENQSYNKMSLEGVCTVMAPNLMIDRQSEGSQSSLSPSLPSLMNRRMSFSSQSVNEVSEEMAAYLRRTTNSLSVLKLLINLHPILFHIPPSIYRQICVD